MAQLLPQRALDTRTERSIFLAVAPGPALQALPAPQQQRLIGRHGAWAEHLVATAIPGECQNVAGTTLWWAELRWAARHEAVHHLDDLLLRRTRLGLLLPQGAAELLADTSPLRAMVTSELGWSDAKWQHECARYRALIERSYSVPANEPGASA